MREWCRGGQAWFDALDKRLNGILCPVCGRSLSAQYLDEFSMRVLLPAHLVPARIRSEGDE